MLPDLSGIDVLRRVRATHPNVPVLFLTAKDAVEDRIAGLTAGGDDYVTKPFSLEEVVARLRALLRRTGAASAREEAVLVVGDLRMDEDSHEVSRDGDGHPPDRHRVRAAALLHAQPASACCPRPRSSTASGSTTSAARPTSSSCTCPTCAARSTRAATPMLHTLRGVGYVLKPVRS